MEVCEGSACQAEPRNIFDWKLWKVPSGRIQICLADSQRFITQCLYVGKNKVKKSAMSIKNATYTRSKNSFENKYR